jgi:DNA-dependent RNA polymerase
MKTYTAWQWLLIDAANNHGLDKLTFDKRIEWTLDNLKDLESLATHEWKEKPLYVKAVMAIRKAQKGIPTGHIVAVDASSSGIQLMSAMTGCRDGALATGLINPEKRSDVYTEATEAMNAILAKSGLSVDIPRNDMKSGLMTAFYGSKLEPIRLFGADTPELAAFYKAAITIAPGAWDLLQELLEAWNKGSKVHSWKMSDGFDVKIKVMVPKEARIEVDELNSATFTYVYYENKGTRRGVSLCANAIHSVDALVVRTLMRKCNYDPEMVNEAYGSIRDALNMETSEATGKVEYYKDLYEASKLADVVVLPYIRNDATGLSKEHLSKLKKLCEDTLKHKPFEVVTIHDSFGALAGNVDHVRYHYKETLADIADSELLTYLLRQLTHNNGTYRKITKNLGDSIRNSNYAVC